MVKQWLNLYFHKNRTFYENKIRELGDRLFEAENNVKTLQYQYEAITAQIDRINREKNTELLGIEKNKKNEYYFIVRRYIDDVSYFYLYPLIKNENYLSQLYLEEKKEYDSNKHVTNRYFILSDVLAIDSNNGNGSMLLRNAIQFAKKNHYSKIKGHLSDADLLNFHKLEHFYSKHGFEVNFNEERTAGSILLNLESDEKK